ncbi:MAG: FKBP-type peptidyl-prolyl cis-trans isomerase [Patescibacteria group bacterium]
MFNRIEIIGFGVAILLMAVALYLVRLESTLLTIGTQGNTQTATAREATESGVVVVEDSDNPTRSTTAALGQAIRTDGTVRDMVIDDVTIGTGPTVVEGDTVRVHYVGRLRTGEEFDNSRKRGEPFSFTVGQGRVIEGWERGVVGMQVGGERILVIPPRMGYGSQGAGPIPPDATLVFAIELLEIVE